MKGIRELAAKLRNLFSTGELQKRYDDGRIQVMTHNGRVLEKKESFPYGFTAKSQSGRVLVFCQGGNYNDFEILPVLKADDVSAPKLEEGDVTLYTESGGWIIARNSGILELYGKDEGGIVKAKELKGQLDKMTARIDGIINALNNSPTAAQDGGAAYKAAITTALAAITDKENFENMESEKVLHGTGN